MEHDVRYDAIFEWGMTAPQTEAYKLAVLYEQEFLKLFQGTEEIDGQGFRRNTIPKKGDPRKSDLFRQCWALRRETRGLLTAETYPNYIKANLLIIKLNRGHVEPKVMRGDKAWVRWKVWERWYTQKLAEKSAAAPPPSISTTNPKVIAEIDRTKKFLFEKCEGEPTAERIQGFIEAGFFKLWIMTGKLSPYYVMMSPYAANDINKLALACSFDPMVYRDKITAEVKDYFNYEFSHEFSGQRTVLN